ncbi:Hypothetical protein EMIHUDRAFT_49528, partial [Emiliania huxleyi CCMP1516]|uniref:PH domain-containing protein n=2 Tax=Emiliania huxleyi TaxID=2903 RepID=A0A0D3KDV0_EMIH1
RREDIRKEGWAWKESLFLRQYRKRWLVLTGGQHARLSPAPLTRHPPPRLQDIDLRQCGTVKSADDLTNKPFSFTVQVPDRNFFLAVDNDADRNEWVAAIGR